MSAEWVCFRIPHPSPPARSTRVRSTHGTNRLSRHPAHDRRRQGRRQERVARRDDRRAVGSRGAGARRVRDHRGRVSRVPRLRSVGGADPPPPRRPRSLRRAGARGSRGRGPRLDRIGPAATGPGARAPRTSCGDGGRRSRLRGRGTLVRHRRRPARRVLRGPAGDAAQRARSGRPRRRGARGVRLALQRPGHRLPRAPGVRAPPRRALGRHPAHGEERSGREWGGLHHRHRVGVRGRCARHRGLGSGGAGGAGPGQPRRVLRAQAQPGSGDARPSCAGRGAARRRRWCTATARRSGSRSSTCRSRTGAASP